MKYLAALALTLAAISATADITEMVDHRYADSDGVRIHYAVAGEGPLVVMIHGFPDYWYSWRHQMDALNDRFRVAAVDQRGYNLSDRPKGVENYAMPLLVQDVAAVIAAEGEEAAIVVGHDWGGAVAWNLAMARPELVDLLVILNLPHPNGLARELMNNPEQQANSQYAMEFKKPDAHKQLTAEALAGWVADDSARRRYVEAFERSDFEAMLNYYKANYPDVEAVDNDAPAPPPLPEGAGAGADVPWPGRPCPPAGRPQRHLELARTGSDAGNRSRRRPLCAAGRRGTGLGYVAKLVAAAAGLNLALAREAGV